MGRRANIWRGAAMAGAAASLAACASLPPEPLAGNSGGPASGVGGTNRPYQVNGRWYTPRDQPDYDEVGTASWYGDAFQMRPTADGEIFDMNSVSAAHTTLPLPSMVEVTNLDNGRKLTVRVNDRGPFVGDRLIDLSHEAARELGFDRKGLARVRVRYVGPAPLLGPEAGVRMASARTARPRQRETQDVAFTSSRAPASAQKLDILPAMPARSPAVAASAPLTSPAPAGAYRIQAGAFGAQANAQRAVSQLASVGQAVIEPMQRNGTTLYRVMLTGPADELQAFGLRERVAQAGFADAKVVRPF